MKPFDPFNDRMARDLRNALSTALVEELTGKAPGALTQQADLWRKKGLAPVYADYLIHRTEAYAAILTVIKNAGHTDPRHQAVALWNAGFLFELHELLETIWMKAGEPERTGLKGVIQAAGAFFHNKRGKPKAAEGLAKRARGHLKAGAGALGFIANLDQLMHDLEHLPAEPTHLTLRQ